MLMATTNNQIPIYSHSSFTAVCGGISIMAVNRNTL